MKNLAWKISNALLAFLAAGIILRNFQEFTNYLWSASLLVALSIGVYFAFGRGAHGAGSSPFWGWVLPAVFLGGLLGVAGAVSALAAKLVLAIAGAAWFYLHQAFSWPLAEHESFTLATGFLSLVFIWALNFFFTPPWWTLMTLTLGIFFLMFLQVFSETGQRPPHLWLWSLLGALIMVEIFWTVLFLPVYFLTAAVLSFAAFYLIYVVTLFHFSGRLTKKKIYFQTGIILLVLIMSLLSSAWGRPQV